MPGCGFRGAYGTDAGERLPQSSRYHGRTAARYRRGGHGAQRSVPTASQSVCVERMGQRGTQSDGCCTPIHRYGADGESPLHRWNEAVRKSCTEAQPRNGMGGFGDKARRPALTGKPPFNQNLCRWIWSCPSSLQVNQHSRYNHGQSADDGEHKGRIGRLGNGCRCRVFGCRCR